MNLLLDTCAFLWFALSPDKLSAAATRLLNDPANRLYFSDASLWEIALKHSSGKLPLPAEPCEWLPSRLAFFQAESLSLNQAAIYLSGELPRVHSDPFDRLLVAQSLEAGMPLLSPDLPLSLLGAARRW